jgi:hypothetical protein
MVPIIQSNAVIDWCLRNRRENLFAHIYPLAAEIHRELGKAREGWEMSISPLIYLSNCLGIATERELWIPGVTTLIDWHFHTDQAERVEG